LPTRGLSEFFFPGVTKEGFVPRQGRSWRSDELRLKSFDDLHKLWYILIKERNMLLTEKVRIDMKKYPSQYLRLKNNLRKVRKSMGRIQGVLGERSRLQEYLESKLPTGILNTDSNRNLEKTKSVGTQEVSTSETIESIEKTEIPKKRRETTLRQLLQGTNGTGRKGENRKMGRSRAQVLKGPTPVTSSQSSSLSAPLKSE